MAHSAIGCQELIFQWIPRPVHDCADLALMLLTNFWFAGLTNLFMAPNQVTRGKFERLKCILLGFGFLS